METDLNQLFNKAIKHEKMKQWSDALTCYKSILKENPSHFESWLNLGAIYFQLKMNSKAIECYNQSLKIREDDRAYYNLGLIYYKSADYGLAIDQFLKSIQRNPDFLQAYLMSGYSYIELNSMDHAVSILKDGLSRDVKSESLLLCLAIAYYTGKNLKMASAVLGELLQYNENNLTALKMKAMISIEGNVNRDSVESYRSLLIKDNVIFEIESMINEPKNRMVHDKIMSVKNELIRKKIKTNQDYLDLSLISIFLGNGNAAMNYLLYSIKNNET
ncbi:MAG: tetratricopeptide repeat protein [Spirochaetia bacterium]|nr:tetratricopeptide repeat protein [Spirochaetia bacterium]